MLMIWFILSLLCLYRLVLETVPLPVTTPVTAIQLEGIPRQAHILGMCR